MEENEKKEQPQEGQGAGSKTNDVPNGQNGEGSSSQNESPLAELKRGNELMKVENDRKEALLKREEEVLAERQLMGEPIGQGQPQKKAVSDADFSKQYENGEVDLFKKE